MYMFYEINIKWNANFDIIMSLTQINMPEIRGPYS